MKTSHTKSITNIISFKLYLEQRPKFIASSADGMLILWNIESIDNPRESLTFHKPK